MLHGTANLSDRFGQLRAMLQSSQGPSAPALRKFLNESYWGAPQEYASQWRPYLAGFSLPRMVARTLQGLEELDRLLPPAIRRSLCIVDQGFGEREEIDKLAGQPSLVSVDRMALTRNAITAQGFEALLRTPHLVGLERLLVGGNQLGAQGARALVESGRLSGLERLDLGANGIGDEGAEALAGWDGEVSLRWLSLSSNGLGEAAAEALAGSAGVAKMRWLDLSKNALDVAALEALSGGDWAQLQTLRLGGNSLGEGAIEALGAFCDRAPRLRWLELTGSGLEPEGLQQLQMERAQPLAIAMGEESWIK